MALNEIVALLERLNDGRLIRHEDNPYGADELTCYVCFGDLYGREGHSKDCQYSKIPQMIDELKEIEKIIEKNGKITNALDE